MRKKNGEKKNEKKGGGGGGGGRGGKKKRKKRKQMQQPLRKSHEYFGYRYLSYVLVPPKLAVVTVKPHSHVTRGGRRVVERHAA